MQPWHEKGRRWVETATALTHHSRCEAFMNPLSANDVFLTVAIMSVTFLIEVGLFILIGML